MSSYSELIKNFERVRSYMREFYVYGFKSREEYDKKSAHSYVTFITGMAWERIYGQRRLFWRERKEAMNYT